MQESAQLSIFKGYADFTSKLELLDKKLGKILKNIVKYSHYLLTS